ncbi:TPA: 3'-5' exoribonuclease [Escherichia coli]|nr:3'-5' exoribonuclease [Escherichia coli]
MDTIDLGNSESLVCGVFPKAIDFDARTAIPFEGERHNALDDARYQAKYVSAIWQKLIPSQADS